MLLPGCFATHQQYLTSCLHAVQVVTRLESIQMSGEMDALDKKEPGCTCTIC